MITAISSRALGLLLAVVLADVAPCFANDLYRYKDQAGTVHYVTDSSKIPEQFRESSSEANDLPQINKMSAGPTTAISQQAFGRANVVKSEGLESRGGDVQIYVTSWCPYCKKLEAFLQEKKIRYTKFDVEKSDVAKKQFAKLGGSGVPMVKIGSKVLNGFSPEAILSALHRKV